MNVFEKLYAKNDDTGSNEQASYVFTPHEEEGGDMAISLSATMNNGQLARLLVSKAGYRNPFENVHFSIENDTGTISNENSIKEKVFELVSELNLGDFYLIEQKTIKNNLVFEFGKKFSNIPVTKAKASAGQGGSVVEEGQEYNAPIFDEHLTIAANDNGINRVSWGSPWKEIGAENENVTQLSIEEVKDIFRKKIELNVFVHENYGNITIDDIRQGYMIMRVKDDNSKYRVIPVWDFIGVYEHPGLDDKTREEMGKSSFLTINAIDGSIINRNLGY